MTEYDLPETLTLGLGSGGSYLRQMSEEAALLSDGAFADYGRLKAVYRNRHPDLGDNDAAARFAATKVAQECVSDVGVYAARAQMFAALAQTRFLEALVMTKDHDPPF